MKRILIIISAVFLLNSCRNEKEESFAFGNFEADEIIVSAEMTGILEEFNINEGMSIEKGLSAGYIDTTQLFLKKNQIRAGISSVFSKVKLNDEQIKLNEINIRNLEREQKRIDALVKDGAATSKQLDDINGQLELLKAQTNVLQIQKASVKTEIESLEIQIAQIDDQLDRSYIRTPVSGIVLEKYQNAGELAVTGKALYKIADLKTLILRVFVQGDQLGVIRLGEDVRVLVDTANGGLKEYAGKISWVSSTAEFTPKIIQTKEERVNLVYAVKILVPNDGTLKIGMPGEISISK